jgi:hypothetical protein
MTKAAIKKEAKIIYKEKGLASVRIFLKKNGTIG